MRRERFHAVLQLTGPIGDVRRDPFVWVAEAKREQTRRRGAENVVTMLRAGRKAR